MLSLCFCLFTAAANGETLESKFAQVAPAERAEEAIERTAGQKRAVVLVQGLTPLSYLSGHVERPNWQSWQRPGGTLIKTLAAEADIFAFAYGQNLTVDQVAEKAKLTDRVAVLKKLGYTDIVLIGHSAGGLVARHLVEDHPAIGVTKVIQVSAPNGGSGWGKYSPAVQRGQETFISSLTPEGRQQCLKCRADKKLPAGVEFVCVVGHLQMQANLEIGIKLALDQRGDGVVASANQWTEDLRCQGVPAVPVAVHHQWVVRSPEVAAVIAKLVREKQPRWDATKMAIEKMRILGE